ASLEALKTDKNQAELFRAASDGVSLLAGYQADRKALVILSTGTARDSGYNEAQLEKAATDAGVKIYTVLFPEGGAANPYLQLLPLLADHTGGAFVQVTITGPAKSKGERIFDWGSFAKRLGPRMTEGGTVTTNLRGGTKGDVVEFNIT